MSHTKLPWLARKGDTLNPERTWGIVRVLSPDEHGCDPADGERTEVIAEVYDTPGDDGQADAEFVVRACNIHDDLVLALKECLAKLEIAETREETGTIRRRFPCSKDEFWQQTIPRMAREAIAKATGETP